MTSFVSSAQSPMIDDKPDRNHTVVNQIDNVMAAADSSGDDVSRRDAWNKKVNGAEAAGVSLSVANGIVIGGAADLWPSLSEGANSRIKPTYRAVPESSVSLTSGTRTSSSKISAGHSGGRTISSHNGTRSGSNRQPNNSAARTSSGNGERSHQQHNRPSSQGPVSDGSSHSGSHKSNSQLEMGQSNGPRPQLHGGGNHTQQRDSNRRGSGGLRGDGSHGRRRNVDRDSNTHPPNMDGRNGPLAPPVFPGSFHIPIHRPALPVVPYPPPPPPLYPPMPFMGPGIHPFTGRPIFYGPPVGQNTTRTHPLFVPMGPPVVIAELCNQINYYFSEENLVRDVHLRRNMDEQGWVMVKTIAVFNKVKEIIAKVKPFLDDNEIDPIKFISNAMLNSYIVEVQGNKLRKRVGWQKYVLPKIFNSSLPAAESHANAELAVRLENTKIEEDSNNSDSSSKAGDKSTDDQVGQQPS